MKIIESDEKRFCNNCYTYGYTWDIYTGKDSAVPKEECYPEISMSLCKKCLVELFKAILER